MNIDYLNALPEAANKYNVQLQDGEKVVFTAKLDTFGNEKDRVLGTDGSKFTLTNQRIIADNGVGIWTNDLAEDVAGYKKVEYGKWVFKGVYYTIDLNKEIIYDNGKQSMSGYHFYIKKGSREKFEEIMDNLFR